MERIVSDVKPSRRYNSTRRQEQAARTRDAVLTAARHRLLTEGYAATTVAAVAEDAGVSVETIYKAFGGKAGLVRAIWERSLGGRGSVPAPVRSDAMSARETDAATILRAWGKLAGEVGSEVVPVLRLVQSAAHSDPAMATLLAESDAFRLTRMRHNARRLMRAGGLRAGISLAEVTDVLWTFSSTEMYELLVLRRGWSAARFGRFVGDAMVAALV